LKTSCHDKDIRVLELETSKRGLQSSLYKIAGLSSL
jgi:hypothetical protein